MGLHMAIRVACVPIVVYGLTAPHPLRQACPEPLRTNPAESSSQSTLAMTQSVNTNAPPAQAASNRRSLKLDTLIAGGTAGGTARTITAPLDRVKILMQTQHLTSGGAPDKYRGLWQAL
eukprot:1043319-Rhodomonas_salina.2